jgi:hypothetical protein
MTASLNNLTACNDMTRLSRRLLLLVLLAFTFMQSISIAHAAEHPFHHDDWSCHVFKAAEKHTLDAAQTPGLPASAVIVEPVSHFVAGFAATASTPAYLSRAPPFSHL